MILKTVFAFFVLVALSTAGYGQQRSDDTRADRKEPIDLGISIPNSAVLITVGGSQAPQETHGSGFLLLRRDDEGIPNSDTKPCRGINDTKAIKDAVPCRILLVTNKHVLPAEGDDSPVFIKVNNFTEDRTAEVRDIEIQVFDDVGRYLPTVKVNPNGYDIAVVDVTADLDRNNLTNFSILRTSVLAVNSNPPGNMRALPAALGDFVFILGYPSGIFDPRNAYPILRSGIIATNPHDHFEFNAQLREKYGFLGDIKGFLIDAAIFPGSSGSLVLRKPINNEFPYTPYAIGIISDSIPIEDLELKSTQRIGLAVVYSSDAIIETLALFK